MDSLALKTANGFFWNKSNVFVLLANRSSMLILNHYFSNSKSCLLLTSSRNANYFLCIQSRTSIQFPHFLTNREASDHRFTFRDTHNFSIPRTSLSMVQKMPLIDFPLTWNNIDESLREITSKNLFKKTLKLELLDNYANFQCSNTICMSCMNI